MKIKAIKKLSRWITIPGLAKKDYQALRDGKTVEVAIEAAQYLIASAFAEIAEAEKKTKAKSKLGGDN